MTTREKKLRELVSQWKRECMVFADMPNGVPVPKRLYLWNRIDELASILNEEVEVSEWMVEVAEEARIEYLRTMPSHHSNTQHEAMRYALTLALKEAGK